MSAALRAALESALAADPDDLAAHMAYADLLSDEGDPRGEFLRLQLARERGEGDETREAELLTAHEDAWLGALAPHHRTDIGHLCFEASFRRGWLDSLDVFHLDLPLAEALAVAPEARLIRRLRFFDTDTPIPWADINPVYHGLLVEGREDAAANPCLAPLAGSANLANVRSFQVGGGETWEDTDDIENPPDPAHLPEVSGVDVFEVVRAMPRLEELRLLARGVDTRGLFCLSSLASLRILQVYDCSNYPLHCIADNPAFHGLTHLLLQPRRSYGEEAFLRLGDLRFILRSPNLPALTHLAVRMSDVGNAGVDEIIASGILRRLKVLDLRYGRVTDRGARRLAACVEARNLQRLVLSNNDLTPRGVVALQSVGVNVIADELGYGTDLFADDME